jgi:DNA-binding LacI/PurR family transcriptional regulator
MIKISEISKITGFSTSTVSRVLNNKGNFKDETVQKIREVVNSLNYKPNNVQEKLINNNFSIAMFIPQRDAFIGNNPSYSSDIPDLREELENCGNMVILAANSEKLDRSSMSFRMIEDKKIDGAVVCGPFVDDEIVEELIAYNIPYIVTNGIDFSKNWNCVDYNNFSASENVIDYLYDLGHRKIGILSGPEKHLISMNRLDGCKSSFQKHNLTLSDDCILFGAFSFDNGYNSAKELLKRNKDITAIFAFDDIIACGATRAIQELGYSIPDDISIIGFDDIELAKFTVPALTTVKRFKYDMYKIVAELVNNLIMNKYIERINITFKTEMVIRDSCKDINNK